ncbi:MAG: 4-hydroxybenzoate octaprenyltransferase [Pseudomonadota bacterium]|nr:4-hydroxybenzoate octaprenyltransferase [Pseudomonadota bacterium]
MHNFRNKFCLYIELIRLNNPVGIFLLIWPPYWVILSLDNPYNTSILLIFFFGVIATRSIGCLINDFLDRDLDINVERTKNRPLALKLISKKEVFLLFLVLSFLNLFLLFMLNTLTIYLGFIGVLLIFTYPLMKRFFPAPQLYLGITFGISALMADTALTNSLPSTASWLFFLATIVWVTMFDTIYAISDKKDDIKNGINSTAILFGNNDKLAIASMQITFFLILFYIGYYVGYGIYYNSFLILCVLIALFNQRLIKDRYPEDCICAFKNNQFIGFFIFTGILLESLQ